MEFTPEQLPRAIRKLLELNNFSVEGPLQIHGAEIDLRARHIGDPFAPPIYIEATIEYVDNDKYGKDVGKLAMISQIEPDAKRLIISSAGFSLPVKERATFSRIETLTYEELFRRFERFDLYISSCLGESSAGAELKELDDIYEEPDFDDKLGRDCATDYLRKWRDDVSTKTRWLVITGEYGTGKTALTKIILLRWLREYLTNPALPLPVRIELKHFSRQFDAKGLLHHFLDHNGLAHISVDFVLSLIRNRRIILILDGYDEMAQYLHARERRACLEALAELSAGGAKGLITSRPNYFTEVEELQVFETLYRSLEHGYYLREDDAKRILEKEKNIDALLGQFIDRFERVLRDLTPEQTEALVARVLEHDTEGRTIVLNLLRRIFRSVQAGDALSLSGKPVIVSYLLDVVENLKSDASARATTNLTEWEVYKLIVDKLMLRDFERTPELNPTIRRSFLQKVAVFLSKKDHPVLVESQFRDLIADEFRQELVRLPPDSRQDQLDQRFADLRTSATLTRSGRSPMGWQFSHNSLREYLSSEFLINQLEDNAVSRVDLPITDAMRTFVASMQADRRLALLENLSRAWKDPLNVAVRGLYLSLFWNGLVLLNTSNGNGVNQIIRTVAGFPADFRSTTMSRLDISSESSPANLSGADFSNAQLTTISLSAADLSNASFVAAVIEEVDFSAASLRNASFRRAFIVDSEFSGAELDGADFSEISPANVSIYLEGGSAKSKIRLPGGRALGYLRFAGAITDPVPDIFVVENYPSFDVVDKIIEKLSEQAIRQRRGLEQRGRARRDIRIARAFVQDLLRNRLIETKMNRKDVLYVTDLGRKIFTEYAAAKSVPEQFEGARPIPDLIKSFFNNADFSRHITTE